VQSGWLPNRGLCPEQKLRVVAALAACVLCRELFGMLQAPGGPTQINAPVRAQLLSKPLL